MADTSTKRERLTLLELDRLMRDPWRTEIRRLAEVMERLASWPWDWLPCEPPSGKLQPAVDMFKEDGRIVVKIGLPGAKPEEIEATIEGDVLTVRRLRTEPQEPAERDYFVREQYSSSFTRTLRLPNDVDADRAEAKLKDGMLTVTLLSSGPTPPQKKLAIKD